MLSLQKTASDRTSLGYDFSSPSIASASTTVFVSPTNNDESKNNDVKNLFAIENIDNGKSILEALPKLDKKEIKNPRAKKGNTQKPKQKKQHLCHHCRAAGHTRPNCYKWLATQQSNSMISSGNQNQFSSFSAPLGDLLKTLMFLSNLTVSILPLHRQIKGLQSRKVLPRCGRKKALSDLVTFSLSPLLAFVFALLVCFAFLF